MSWGEWLMAKFGRPKPDPVEPVQRELQQVEQKIEVTVAAKAQAEQAAAITGEYDAFRPVMEEKTAQLARLERERVRLLERQRQIIARQYGGS